ncbi:MAG: hypothetical protein EP329_13445 [Deltaproteobacteria bacterium]|nr:MAG: hypothetical protein EP329_13445 [Deltaproteobacteria bacterium]
MTVRTLALATALLAAPLAGCLDDASRGATADTGGDTVTTEDVGDTRDAGDDDTSGVATCGGRGLQCMGTVAAYCTSAGEVVASAECARWGRICVDGVCALEVCTPGASACVGDAIGTCDASGTRRTVVACDPGAVCVADDAGPVCVAATCVPGTSTCVGDAVARCVAPGEPPQLAPCEAGSHCADGACVPDGSCAAPVIAVDGPVEVAPHATVHLTAARTDLSHHWRFTEQPAGATAIFSPNATAAAVSVRLDVVGAYRVALEAVDMNGQGCGAAELVLTVVPAAPVHVELVWQAGAPEAAAGADLDLHVVTPIQPGGPQGVALVERLFDTPWDTSWLTPSPNSDPLDPAVDDDARLLHDDTDGAGPETVAIGLPHVGAEYLVAVHGWSDHGAGASEATLRVYVYGALAFTAERSIDALDLWPAAVVRWPSGEVLPVGGCGDAGEVLCTDAAACRSGESCLPVTWPGYLPPQVVVR